MKSSIASASPDTLTTLGFEYAVLARKEIGPAHLAWVKVTPTDETVRSARSLPRLQLEETGVVARARVRNPHAFPALLTADLVLRGGYQTRVMERSVVVPPGATIEVPVRCVEQGRWRPAGPTPWAFAAAETTSTHTRATFLREKRTRYVRTQSYSLDQRSVWNHVDEELTRTGVSSPSRSYAAYLDGPRAAGAPGAPSAPFAAETPDDANAFAISIPGAFSWFEAFPSHAELMASAPAMLADAAEAIRSIRTRRAAASSSAAAPSLNESPADTLIAWVWNAPMQRLDPVRGAWGTTSLLATAQLSGEVVWSGDGVMHIAATCGG